MKNTYFRGDLYYADLGAGVGSEQSGYRPVVIIQNNVGNKHSPTTIVAAISTQIKTKANLPTHYHLKPGNGLVQTSMVMLEQIRTIDKSRLVQYIGKLSNEEIKGLNHALAISIGLISSTPAKLTLCLCSTCAENFYGSGAYILRRLNPIEVDKDMCTYCSQRVGFDYEITKRKDR
ncbi:MAG: type II toxin-antitoxin system PemK/MazF family toxin [Faecousia sp.]